MGAITVTVLRFSLIIKVPSPLFDRFNLSALISKHLKPQTPNPGDIHGRKTLPTRTGVVIIYCSIFLPLLLTVLSVNLVLLLTLSRVTVPLSTTP